MKLERNLSPESGGKYTVFKTATGERLDQAVGARDEGFWISLKDRHAQAALLAYAESAEKDDPEYAAEVRDMAGRAGPASPFCKRPD